MVNINDGAFGEAAYCHHRHHLDEHSQNFDTCRHSICVCARLDADRRKVERRGQAAAWRDVAKRLDDAHNYVHKHNVGRVGQNVWHIILDDAIRMRGVCHD